MSRQYKSNRQLVIGVDFGTDSVRSVLIDAKDGSELASKVHYFKRWAEGLYCDPPANQFRQHPQDYIDGLTSTISEIVVISGAAPEDIKGICVDTTGSTPVAVDEAGLPLALLPRFEDNPNAMFVLWKDHTAIKEADDLKVHATKYKPNYLQFVGGNYSSEWFWAKILHLLRVDPELRSAAYSWVEHCDWIPFLLTGGTDVREMKRGRCSAGHKALWHKSYGGLPPNNFWKDLDPLLDGLTDRLYKDTYTSDQSAGRLSKDWADRLGLHEDVEVAVGAFDAHIGAVGGEIRPYTLLRILGTSTCDVMVVSKDELGDHLVKGISGQVDGSVIPGMIGMDAGQAAMGDMYAWFKNLLAWPIEHLLPDDFSDRKEHISSMIEKIIPELSKQAQLIAPGESPELVLDWINGRRTPDTNDALKGAIFNLNLGSDAPRIFRAIVEATCYGGRAIVERFRREGIRIDSVIATGGVAKKSPFVMQTLANVLNMPIKVAKSDQSVALGAAMFAATAAGIYSDVETAQAAIGHGFEKEYLPEKDLADLYDTIYQNYLAAGKKVEELQQ